MSNKITGLALGLGIVAAGALSVTTVVGGAALSHHNVALTAADDVTVGDAVTQFDPTLAQLWGATNAVDGKSTPLTDAQLGDLVKAFNTANGSLDDADQADIHTTPITTGTGTDAVTTDYYGLVQGAGTGGDDVAEGQDPTAYLFTVKDGVVSLNSAFDQGELTDTQLGGLENDFLSGIWGQLNTVDTTGFGDINTYLAGLDSQQDEINSLLNDPWYIVGQDYDQVVADLSGTDGASFTDLFTDGNIDPDTGDLLTLFTDLGAALSI